MNWRDLLSHFKPGPKMKILGERCDRHEADLHIFDALAQHGADLTQPREIRHFFYLPTSEAADLVGDALLAEGFRVEVGPSAGATAKTPNPWLALATATAIVDIDSIEEAYARFDDLARLHGGEYDGWECAAQP
jgi:hypothetical protein